MNRLHAFVQFLRGGSNNNNGVTLTRGVTAIFRPLPTNHERSGRGNEQSLDLLQKVWGINAIRIVSRESLPWKRRKNTTDSQNLLWHIETLWASKGGRDEGAAFETDWNKWPKKRGRKGKANGAEERPPPTDPPRNGAPRGFWQIKRLGNHVCMYFSLFAFLESEVPYVNALKFATFCCLTNERSKTPWSVRPLALARSFRISP